VRARIFLLSLLATSAWTQEASSGFELRTTLTAAGIVSDQLTQPPRSGSAGTAGFRAMLYPTWKLSQNWAVSGTVQVHTRPFFNEQFSTQGRGIRGDILQAHLSYSRFGNNKSIVVRAGQLSSAFGAFLTRYDDADNPLPDMPLAYGYYYKSVSTYGLAGAEVDVTFRKLDARVQFVNSSAANRRSVFDSDQYGNWAGGIGYTVVQGFRVGTSAYYGPYLHREFVYYRPGEAKPGELRASAFGIDTQWARGYWSTHGEWQWFKRPYRAMPTFTQTGGYAEARRVLHPRWYLAGRINSLQASVGADITSYETAVGFRPGAHQLIKAGYQVRNTGPGASFSGTFVVQFITQLRALSLSRD
jgi:hypothetical protein